MKPLTAVIIFLIVVFVIIMCSSNKDRYTNIHNSSEHCKDNYPVTFCG